MGQFVTLSVAVESFGTLVSTVVIDKLSPDIKANWNIAKILELLNEELEAHEIVNVEGKDVNSDVICHL